MIKTAIKAAKEAGKFIKQNAGTIQSKNVDRKLAFDFVTDIDKESEEIIIDIIKKEFPDHKILAEESLRQESGGFRWIIDPLDGTTNFIHNYPAFAVSIALEKDNEIILGVVYDPLHDELFHAEKGKGAFLDNSPIYVSAIADPGVALLATGFPFRSKEYLDLYLKSFQQLFKQVSGIRRAGSVALDFCHLACGRCDGFWEIKLGPWDIAAGSLIIKEAGGLITDFANEDDPMWTGNVIASNGLLHDTIFQVVNEVFKGHIDK